MGRIRTAARALIVREGRLLLTHCRDGRGDYYIAPGGGQVEGETLPETLVRECREELGAEVEVGELRFVRDYIPSPDELSYLSEDAHQLELFFECRVAERYRADNGPQADHDQVGVIWADAEALGKLRVYPARLRDVLYSVTAPELPVYWGSGD